MAIAVAAIVIDRVGRRPGRIPFVMVVVVFGTSHSVLSRSLLKRERVFTIETFASFSVCGKDVVAAAGGIRRVGFTLVVHNVIIINTVLKPHTVLIGRHTIVFLTVPFQQRFLLLLLLLHQQQLFLSLFFP